MSERFAFFIGCTVQVRLPYIESLARRIFSEMGIELADLDFSCCPTARIVKDVSIETWLLIAARNLAIAEKEKLNVLSMCTGCTQTLREAQEMLENQETRRRINEQLEKSGLQYYGTSEVHFYAQAIYERMERLKIKSPPAIKVATHSGCHILRPSRILGFDNPERPEKLDLLVKALGCDIVDYPHKGMCCGFPLYGVDQDAAERMMRDKIASIADADCLALLCPTCLEYYQLRQEQVASRQGFKPLTAVHYLQLLGLAMGIKYDDTGLGKLRHLDEKLRAKLRAG